MAADHTRIGRHRTTFLSIRQWLIALLVALSVLLGAATVSVAQSGDAFDDDDDAGRDTSPPPDESEVFYTDANDRRQSLDVYLPAEDGENRPAVVFIHGGGFRRGTKNTFRLEGDIARERGWVGFSINYRLDENPGHPAEMNDVLDAITWVRNNADEYGVDPNRIAVWGTSAGASLGALAATVPTGPLTEGDRVMAVVAFSGPMELVAVHSARNAGTIEAYLGCAPTTCPDLYADASATSHVTPDDPPMFLAHSEREGIPVEVTVLLAERLEEEGVTATELEIVPGALHARSLSLRTPGLMDKAFEFLDARFAATTAPPTTTSSDTVAPPETTAPTPSTSSSPGDDPAPTVTSSVPDDSDTSNDNDDGGGVPIGVVLVIAAVALGVGVGIGMFRRGRSA